MSFTCPESGFRRVFWVGPILGGVCGAFCFQFIFNVQRPRSSIKDMEANMSMVNNSEEDMIDDLERVKQYRSNMMQVIKYKDQTNFPKYKFIPTNPGGTA